MLISPSSGPSVAHRLGRREIVAATRPAAGTEQIRGAPHVATSCHSRINRAHGPLDRLSGEGVPGWKSKPGRGQHRRPHPRERDESRLPSAGERTVAETAPEPLHATARIENLLFAGVERVARRTHVEVHVATLSGTGFNDVAAAAGGAERTVFRMNVCFHGCGRLDWFEGPRSLVRWPDRRKCRPFRCRSRPGTKGPIRRESAATAALGDPGDPRLAGAAASGPTGSGVG